MRNPASWSVARVLLFPIRLVLVVFCIALALIALVPATIFALLHKLNVPYARPIWGIVLGPGMWVTAVQQLGSPHAEAFESGIRIRIWPFAAGVREVLWNEVAAIRPQFAVYVPPRTIVLSSGQELTVKVFDHVAFDSAARQKGVLRADG